MKSQRGVTLMEVSIGMLVGMGVIALVLTGSVAYQNSANGTACVMSVRDLLKQSSTAFGGGRSGYPAGTAVAEELVRLQQLPRTLESTAPGIFALSGIGQLTHTVPLVGTSTRGTEQQVTLVFSAPVASGNGPCRVYARALRGWATRISDGTTSPVDGQGQILGEAAYETFWESRCAANNAQVVAWFR